MTINTMALRAVRKGRYSGWYSNKTRCMVVETVAAVDTTVLLKLHANFILCRTELYETGLCKTDFFVTGSYKILLWIHLSSLRRW